MVDLSLFMCLSVATLSKLSENNEIFKILPGLVLALDFFRELPPLLLFPFFLPSFLPPFFITQPNEPMTATEKTTCLRAWPVYDQSTTH